MMNAKAPPHAFFPSRPPGIFVRGFYFCLDKLGENVIMDNGTLKKGGGKYNGKGTF